jgi:hypothetical protein
MLFELPFSTPGAQQGQAQMQSMHPGPAPDLWQILVEVLITTAVLMIITIGAAVALATFNRNVERMTDYCAGNIAIEGELERVRTIKYQPPLSPFSSTNVTWLSNVTLSLDRNGTNYQLIASMRTTTEPRADGHLVTVTLTYNNWFRPTNIWMQTVVNGFSGGQP